ncbi:MAG TPA: von Willebrand factor type A domain-containing protein [Verrucomicrobiae bacterium]
MNKNVEDLVTEDSIVAIPSPVTTAPAKLDNAPSVNSFGTANPKSDPGSLPEAKTPSVAESKKQLTSPEVTTLSSRQILLKSSGGDALLGVKQEPASSLSTFSTSSTTPTESSAGSVYSVNAVGYLTLPEHANPTASSDESKSIRRPNVAIALPQVAAEEQSFKREPQVQIGPVVVSEIQLKNSKPSELVPALQPLQNLPQAIVANDSSKTLVLSDSPENVKRMTDLIEKIDVVPPTEIKSVIIPVKYALASDIATVLGSVTAGGGGVSSVGQRQPLSASGLQAPRTVGGISGYAGAIGAAPPTAFQDHLRSTLGRAGASGDISILGQSKIIADERTQSLLIFASENYIAAITNVIAKLDTEANEYKKREDVALQRRAVAGIPQPEVSVTDNAFSTFSLNVSDVSFKLAAASLEKGQMPDPATVRSEEFINAFDYRDCEPQGNAPVAFAWERARYPFAHDRDLLRFSIKTAAIGRQPGRPLNLVLLLDNSGSMERADRVRIIQECLRVLAGQLQPQDIVSVVAFARTPRLWIDGLPGSQAGELPQRVGGLTPQGGTNLEDAMNLAYQTAQRHFLAQGVNRVVLLTDGAANLGDVEPESLKKKVEANRKQGIALDCFGIGWEGFNDELLEMLSRNGDGRYGFVNTPEAASAEFAGQLAGALKVAASDVKVQVEFNPRRTTAYRQIGYAKHQLKKEQFRDNTVDAAEIGAAEAGNALYVVQVNPAGEGPIGTVRVRFKVPGTTDYREHDWPVPYEGAARSLEQSSAALRLAATASAFSEWLVSSPYAAEVTPDRLLAGLNGVPETWSADPRPKKLEWMIRQAKSLAGK